MEELMKSLEGSKGKQKEPAENSLPKQVVRVVLCQISAISFYHL